MVPDPSPRYRRLVVLEGIVTESGYWWVLTAHGDWELISVDGERTWIMGSEESCPLKAYQDATRWVRVLPPDEYDELERQLREAQERNRQWWDLMTGVRTIPLDTPSPSG
jgi:hypothetical protein